MIDDLRDLSWIGSKLKPEPSGRGGASNEETPEETALAFPRTPLQNTGDLGINASQVNDRHFAGSTGWRRNYFARRSRRIEPWSSSSRWNRNPEASWRSSSFENPTTDLHSCTRNLRTRFRASWRTDPHCSKRLRRHRRPAPRRVYCYRLRPTNPRSNFGDVETADQRS